MRVFTAVTCLMSVALLAAPSSAQTIGAPLPELDVSKWYNIPELTPEDLRGKAVLFEVFRTW